MATGVIVDEGIVNFTNQNAEDLIKKLYPMVNEDQTVLPRCWSSKDKFNFIGLSQNNLRVHYKGHGKSQKDAASVRAAHPIPASCGLYYYEVKIVSKGRDGHMGIGLSAQGVNLNRLPGLDKNSYGYHGDDGHSYCTPGTGQPYGPTFTTGDVIGCGINLIDNVCFYTKNGHYLGIAFKDLPPNLYPVVGLQTPGEIIDTNFGQTSFVFDISEMMREVGNREHLTIQNFPLSDTFNHWESDLQKIVSTYLVHHGYCAAAEAFTRSTSQDLDEELISIRNRQKVQKLVLAGRLGEAIRSVKDLYPGLLDKNPDLLFTLRVRQFIEMVNGTDVNDLVESGSPQHSNSNLTEFPPLPSPSSHSPVEDNDPITSCWSNGKADYLDGITLIQHTSVIQSTKNVMSNNPTTEEMNQRNAQQSNNSSIIYSLNSTADGTPPIITSSPIIVKPPSTSSSSNSVSTSSTSSTTSHMNDSDVDIDFVEATNANNLNESVNRISDMSNQSNGFTNGFEKHADDDDDVNSVEDMDIEGCSPKMCRGNPSTIQQMLLLGRELQQMSQNLRREMGKNKQNKTMLQDAFSLLAYNDPWNSPVGWQLDPVQREPVCQALNSAILESYQLPRRPPLEICIAHTKQLINLMAKSGVGSCAFVSVESILNSNKKNWQLSQSRTSEQHILNSFSSQL